VATSHARKVHTDEQVLWLVTGRADRRTDLFRRMHISVKILADIRRTRVMVTTHQEAKETDRCRRVYQLLISRGGPPPERFIYTNARTSIIERAGRACQAYVSVDKSNKSDANGINGARYPWENARAATPRNCPQQLLDSSICVRERAECRKTLATYRRIHDVRPPVFSRHNMGINHTHTVTHTHTHYRKEKERKGSSLV